MRGEKFFVWGEKMSREINKFEKAKRIGRIARERAIEYYEIKKVAAEYEAAVKQVANGN